MNSIVSTVLETHGLCWNLGSIYPGLDSREFHLDLRAAHAELRALEGLLAQDEGWCSPSAASTAAGLLQEFSRRCSRASDLLADLHVYCNALLSLGEVREASQQALRRVSALVGLLQVVQQRLGSTLSCWPQIDFDSLCASQVDDSDAVIHWQMLRDKAKLPTADPTVSLLAPEASRAWSALYQVLARDLTVCLPQPSGVIEEVSLARATAALKGTDTTQRERAWHAIRAAWSPHENTVAAVLNSLTGHRLKVQRLAGATNDARASSLVENRIQASTLDALMAAVQARRSELRIGLKQMASMIGKPVLDPWDLAAEHVAVDSAAVRFSPLEGLAEVRAAFAAVAPVMGDFVDLMATNGWIDARPCDARRQLGAYQTSLRRGGHPIVFTNYEGRWSDLIVLAHELGHAFHFWVLRDRPARQHHLPIALAECASSFTEMQVRRRRMLVAQGDVRLAGDWNEAQAAVAFLLNIGASYTFELDLYQQRSKREQTAEELSEGMASSWKYWFGQDISAFDDRGWVRKAHFSGSRPFNNYPYMIGYLMAIRLEDERSRRGPEFFPVFESFLRGSATLSLEDLVKRLFDQDAVSERFWHGIVDLVLARLNGDTEC